MYSNSDVQNLKSPYGLLHALCKKVTGLDNDEVTQHLKMAVKTVGADTNHTNETEFQVAERIKRRFVRENREKDAALFSELHRKLQGSRHLSNRASLLHLLYMLSNDGSVGKTVTGSAFYKGISTHAMSTPYPGHIMLGVRNDEHALNSGRPLPPSASSAGSSGISSIHGSGLSDGLSPYNGTRVPGSTVHLSLAPNETFQRIPGRKLVSMDRHRIASHIARSSDASGIGRDSDTGTVTSKGKIASKKSGDNSAYELPENVLMREIIYIFQGIEGKYIKFDVSNEGFRIEPRIGIPKAVRTIVSKLAECGWLYNKARKYADSRSTDRAFGLVGQSFCTAIHSELTEYYRLMAVLEAQLQQEEDFGVGMQDSGLSLRRLAVWTCEPTVRLKALAALIDVSHGKKGGALASAIHSYIQHGDPCIRSLVQHTLVLVAQPIFSTVLKWIYDGELEDTYHEFFVASNPTVRDDRLWHEKYSLCEPMIPSFLTMEQAKQILLTGKSINYLRQVCHDRTIIRSRSVVKATETNQVETILNQDLDRVFQRMIDVVYEETSKHLLEVLQNKYKFLEHLKAMRRYLLLGQGDFIRHLMDLLEDNLIKPAQTVFMHNLTGALESAVRATNAQFDDADILRRLDFRLLEVSAGDIGWDVFSLDYHVDGPIRTVFTPDCMFTYLRVFNFLWRAKRIEYILASIWKEQMFNARRLRSIPEIFPLLHQHQIIGSEMLHFVQQVQYYINFEVLECSWDELLREVMEAKDLDQIISAHQVFLENIVARSLLHPQSSNILTQLRTIFDLVIQFQQKLDSLYQAAEDELAARQAFQERKNSNTKRGEWGLTEADQIGEDERQQAFREAVIASHKRQLFVLAESYQDMVRQFLLMLAGHTDIKLRFLSFRLDFNEHYRSRDSKLRSPLAYHKVKPRREQV